MSDLSPANYGSPSRHVVPHQPDTVGFRVCDCCRTKKTRCDMVRPVCGTCRSRQTVCAYSKRRKKPGPPKGCQRKVKRLSDASSSAAPTLTIGSIFPPSLDSHEADVYGEVVDDITTDSNVATLPCVGNELAAQIPCNDNAAIMPRLCISPSQSFPESCLHLSPELEAYLLELYFQHLQPTYPLLRRPSKVPSHNISKASFRLKLAIHAVASRFAESGVLKGPISSTQFAQLANSSERDSDLNIDEIKASLLLCIYRMSESLTWDTVAEIARISRMAELYYILNLEKHHEDTNTWASGDETTPSRQENLENKTDMDRDTEDWKSVWWCIYSLETTCSALASSSTVTASSLQGRVELPAVSIADFTNSLLCDSSPPKDKMPLIPPIGVKHWEIMRMIYSETPCGNRNLYFGACTLMRSVTDLRSLSNRGHCKDLHKRLQELESDCTATSFALPPWFFNATRNLVIGETEEEHQQRLNTLLVWFGANILLAICAAKISSRGTCLGPHELQVQWHAILAKANEVVVVIQNWRPSYFRAVDPMCSYIVYLTASIIAHDRQFLRGIESSPAHSDEDLDLLGLFLDQMASNWPVAHHLTDALKSLRATMILQIPVYKEALAYLFRLTSPFNGQILFTTTKPVDANLRPADDALSINCPQVGSVALSTHASSALPDSADVELLNYQWLNELDFESLGEIHDGSDLTDVFSTF